MKKNGAPHENQASEASEKEASPFFVAAAREYSHEDILRAAPDAAAFASDFLNNAVLVYGPRKSGTTLLQSLLDGGTNLLMLPGEAKIKFLFEPRCESPYLLRYALKSGTTDFTFERAKSGAAPSYENENVPHFPGLTAEDSTRLFDAPRYFETLKKLHESQPNHSYARAARGDDNDVAPELLRDELRAEVAAFAACLKMREYSRTTPQRETQIAGDSETLKNDTPREYSQGVAAPQFRGFAVKEVGGDPQQIIARWRRILPQTQVVFLVRDPRFVVRSIVLDRRRKGVRLGFWNVIKECEETCNIIAAALRCDGCEVLCYEDLTRDARGEMQRLCARLELDFDEKLCAPTMLGASAVVRTSSKATFKVFHEKKNWHDDLLPHQRLAISLFHAIAPFTYALKRRNFVRYDALQKTLQTRRNAKS